MITSRIKDEFYETVESLKHSSGNVSKENVVANLDKYRKQLGEQVANRPAECLIGAVAVGFIFGWWMKHK